MFQGDYFLLALFEARLVRIEAGVELLADEETHQARAMVACGFGEATGRTHDGPRVFLTAGPSAARAVASRKSTCRHQVVRGRCCVRPAATMRSCSASVTRMKMLSVRVRRWATFLLAMKFPGRTCSLRGSACGARDDLTALGRHRALPV